MILNLFDKLYVDHRPRGTFEPFKSTPPADVRVQWISPPTKTPTASACTSETSLSRSLSISLFLFYGLIYSPLDVLAWNIRKIDSIFYIVLRVSLSNDSERLRSQEQISGNLLWLDFRSIWWRQTSRTRETILLQILIQLWIVIRAFCFVTSWVKLFINRLMIDSYRDDSFSLINHSMEMHIHCWIFRLNYVAFTNAA